MPWQFWGIFKGHGLNHQVTDMPHFFLGEGFWKQDLVKHPPKKKAKKKCIRKKRPKKMVPKKNTLQNYWIPQKPFFLNLGGTLLGLASKHPLLAGDYASYNDCGVVNGITADAFIVAG